jgi:hypothetical protein
VRPEGVYEKRGDSVWAQDLTVGLGIPITSLDPHFANNSPNKAVAR